MPTIEKHRKPWQPEPRKRKGANESWVFDARYRTARWKRYRKTFLSNNRLCAMCQSVDKVVMATVVDHKQPVSKGGDFWDSDNHQALCKPCNSRKIRKK